MKKDRITAVSLAVERLHQALTLLESDADVVSAEELRRRYKREVLTEILTWQFKTNDFVILIPGQKSGRLQVNASTFDLDTREFLVLKAMAAARSSMGLGSFVPIKTILAHIERYRAEAGLEQQWRDPVPEDVRKAVKTVRDKVSKTASRRSLIESGMRGDGYRISTPMVEIFTKSTVQQEEE